LFVQIKGVDESAAKMKQFVLDKLRGSKVPQEALVTASISKGNVCVAGDALHPMTPDLGQGGCSALEDGIVLARCLGEGADRGRHATIRQDARGIFVFSSCPLTAPLAHFDSNGTDHFDSNGTEGMGNYKR